MALGGFEVEVEPETETEDRPYDDLLTRYERAEGRRQANLRAVERHRRQQEAMEPLSPEDRPTLTGQRHDVYVAERTGGGFRADIERRQGQTQRIRQRAMERGRERAMERRREAEREQVREAEAELEQERRLESTLVGITEIEATDTRTRQRTDQRTAQRQRLDVDFDREYEFETEREAEREAEAEFELRLEHELERELEQEMEFESESETELEVEPFRRDRDDRKRSTDRTPLDIGAEVYEAPVATAREVSAGLEESMELDALTAGRVDTVPHWDLEN